MKILSKIITAALVIIGVLGLSGCSEDISTVSTTSAQVEVNSNTEDTADTQLSEAEISNELNNESSDTGSISEAISNDYMADGVFDLEGYMSKFQFGERREDSAATEVIYYINNREPHIFATLTISSYKNIPGTNNFFVEDNSAGKFYTSSFIKPSDDIITTNIDGIILNQRSLDILRKLIEEREVRLVEGNYPFEGLDLDSWDIDMNN